MNLLFEHFDTLINAPDGIKKMRELILQLAVQGKLVPQDPEDEPASVLLEKIKAEKAKLIKAGKIKAQKPLPEIKDEEKPFELPKGWEWCNFDQCIILRDGERIPLSREVRLMRQGTYDYYGASGVIDHIDDYIFDKPLLLIGEDGANLISRSTPIAFIAKGKYWVNNHAHVIDSISEEFLSYLGLYINSIDLKPYVTGTAQPKMNQQKMRTILLCLPPLNEQKRIVAKVDQLMSLCDELEKQKEQAEKKKLSLNKASLFHLLNAENQKSFATYWQQVTTNFDLLFSTPESVKDLKQAILQLAVQGKLVPQDPKDEPASKLLEKIKTEKAKLIKEGKIKAQKPLPEIKDEEKPFELPKGWVWSVLDKVGIVNPRNYANDNLDVTFVPMKNIYAEYGKAIQTETRKWSEIKTGFTHFAEKDVVLAKITPCFENAKSAVMEGLENGIGAGTTELHVFRPLKNRMISEYILVYLKSPKFIEDGKHKMTGSAGQKRVPKEYFGGSPLPLPPLNEQKRIVAKVDQLMVLCDELEKSLTHASHKSQKIFNSIVSLVGKR